MAGSNTTFGLMPKIKKSFYTTGLIIAFFGLVAFIFVHFNFHPPQTPELIFIGLFVIIFFIPLFYVPMAASIRMERDAMTYSWILQFKLHYSDILRMGYGIQQEQKFGIHLLTGMPTKPLRLEHSRGILAIPINYFENNTQVVANIQKITGLAVENPATF
ncbi:MAG: hypothetical protein V2A78_13615 [bacterium]